MLDASYYQKTDEIIAMHTREEVWQAFMRIFHLNRKESM